eukprot:Selendium_serpulae@DN9567_c0_g1_i1.p1
MVGRSAQSSVVVRVSQSVRPSGSQLCAIGRAMPPLSDAELLSAFFVTPPNAPTQFVVDGHVHLFSTKIKFYNEMICQIFESVTQSRQSVESIKRRPSSSRRPQRTSRPRSRDYWRTEDQKT